MLYIRIVVIESHSLTHIQPIKKELNSVGALKFTFCPSQICDSEHV